MKTNLVLDASKVIPSVAQQKYNNVKYSLKTFRKSHNDTEQLRNQIEVGFRHKEDCLASKEKLLNIKNIPTMSRTFFKEGKPFERSIWNHKSMIVRNR